MIEIFDMPQGSLEWYEARCGIPTASDFHLIMAKGQGKVRRGYMNRLAAERITGKPAETYSNYRMQLGKELEAEARDHYAFVHDRTPQIVGFVRNGDVGCSPDAWLEEDGTLELKTKDAGLLIDVIDREEIPPEFRAQVQGGLWVCERSWCDLACYWPGMPMKLFHVRRDDEYIANLASEVSQFCAELEALVERIKNPRTPSEVLRAQLERSAAQ